MYSLCWRMRKTTNLAPPTRWARQEELLNTCKCLLIRNKILILDVLSAERQLLTSIAGDLIGGSNAFLSHIHSWELCDFWWRRKTSQLLKGQQYRLYLWIYFWEVIKGRCRRAWDRPILWPLKEFYVLHAFVSAGLDRDQVPYTYHSDWVFLNY